MALIDNLVSYYKLDETSGDVVDSEGNNNGTNYGASRGETGKINNCFSFDGNNDYVDISTGDLGHDNISFSLWVCINDGTGEGEERIVKGDNSFEVKIETETEFEGEYWFWITLEVKDSDGWNGAYSNPGAWAQKGKWTHLAGTYDGSERKMYANGSITETETNQSGPIEEYKITYFGFGNDGFNDIYANIKLDEVAFFKEALSESEVRKLYNSGDGLRLEYMKMIENTSGEKELKTKWPHEKGNIARTTSQKGRVMNLRSEKSFVRNKNKVGL